MLYSCLISNNCAIYLLRYLWGLGKVGSYFSAEKSAVGGWGVDKSTGVVNLNSAKIITLERAW